MIVSDLPGYLADLRESLELAQEAAEQVVEEIQDNGAAVAAPDDLDELRGALASAESVVAHVRAAIHVAERAR